MKTETHDDVVVTEVGPAEEFAEEVLRGLTAKSKTLPCKFFYDERGSQLFDQICELEEYYPTRTENSILRDNISEISCGVRAQLPARGTGERQQHENKFAPGASG